MPTIPFTFSMSFIKMLKYTGKKIKHKLTPTQSRMTTISPSQSRVQFTILEVANGIALVVWLFIRIYFVDNAMVFYFEAVLLNMAIEFVVVLFIICAYLRKNEVPTTTCRSLFFLLTVFSVGYLVVLCSWLLSSLLSPPSLVHHLRIS
jgi:hypothetical protein